MPDSTPFDMVRPFDKLRDRRLTNRVQGPSATGLPPSVRVSQP